MPLLSFQCRHQFRSGFALDLEFAAEQRFTVLFGPSGSGKTTALAMIAGFVRPQQGRICVGERVLLDTAAGIDVPPEDRGVGLVYQDALLFPHLSVERNLRYGQRHRRQPCRQVDFARVVDVLELGPLLRRSPDHLSGGERQRVALGRALLSGPALLLMDEPLAALDAPLKLKILTYLERIVAQWDVPTLFVTHAQAEVRRAASWVVVVNQGRRIAAGPPDEALTSPEPLAWSGSEGPVNLLRADDVRVEGRRLAVRVAGLTLFVPLEGVPIDAPAFVQFAPRDVILTRHDAPGLSVRNHLRGRVCRISAASAAVFVAVDVGAIVWAEITPEAAAELALQPGDEVTCLVKAHHLSLITG